VKQTVYIVDDDFGMRKSLARVMESAALEAQLYESAEAFLDDYKPDAAAAVLVLDLQMPGMHGVELLRHLRSRDIHMPVIIVTGTGTVPMAVETMKLGAVEFMEKPVDPHVLVNRVEQSLASESARQVEVSEIEAIQKRFDSFTDREREVLDLIISGQSNKQIATTLQISIKTVAVHRAKLMLKTSASNTADLVRMSMVANRGTPARLPSA